jgi:hypothetical protein
VVFVFRQLRSHLDGSLNESIHVIVKFFFPISSLIFVQQMAYRLLNAIDKHKIMAVGSVIWLQLICELFSAAFCF